jgi:hypothetical protein
MLLFARRAIHLHNIPEAREREVGVTEKCPRELDRAGQVSEIPVYHSPTRLDLN